MIKNHPKLSCLVISDDFVKKIEEQKICKNNFWDEVCCDTIQTFQYCKKIRIFDVKVFTISVF